MCSRQFVRLFALLLRSSDPLFYLDDNGNGVCSLQTNTKHVYCYGQTLQNTSAQMMDLQDQAMDTTEHCTTLLFCVFLSRDELYLN
jgi:hypothetical protein